MKLNNLPIIDWNLAIKLAGNKQAFAEEILDILVKNLPNDVAKLKELLGKENYLELWRHLHKLHGALCYCGLPRLKSIVWNLEIELKSDKTQGLPALIDELETETAILLDYYLSRAKCSGE